MSEQPSLEEIKQQCIFCQIINGQVPSKKIYEDKYLTAILDINPANPGHIIVLTKEHYSIMPQLPQEIIEHLGKISKALSQVLLKTLQCEGTSVFVANGPAAGQRAQHFMLHLIPRNENDGVNLFLPEKQMPEELIVKLKQLLSDGLKKNLGVELKVESESTKVNPESVTSVLADNDENDEKNEDEQTIDDKETDETVTIDDIANLLK